MRREEGKLERRSSSRQPVPDVLVALTQSIDSESPQWVCSAVDVSSKGILLHLPPELGLREMVRVTFSLSSSCAFSQLRAIVVRRDLGDLGMLFFAGWPLHKQKEMSVWLRDQALLVDRKRPPLTVS